MDLTPCDGCDGCGLRCAAGVPLTREEYDAVRRYIASAPDREYIQRVAAQDKTVDLGDGVTVQMCRYRDMERGLCAIYPARPLICRLFGFLPWLPCPIEKVPQTVRPDDAVALMAAYAQQPRKTFEEWDAEDMAEAGEQP